MCICLNVKHPLLPYFNETWLFSTDFSKNTQTSYFMKICPADLFQAKGKTDGQTDMTKLIVAFCNFAHTHLKMGLHNDSTYNICIQEKMVCLSEYHQLCRKQEDQELQSWRECVLWGQKGLQEWKQIEGEEWQIGTVRYKCITKVTYAP